MLSQLFLVDRHRLRSRHTSVTVWPCPNPSRVDMSPQQPLERRWERLRSAMPRSPIYRWSSTMTSGQRRRTSAEARAKPTVLRRGLGRKRNANRSARPRGPRFGAGRRFRIARRPRMLPTQSVLKPQPWTKAARTPRRTLPRTSVRAGSNRDARVAAPQRMTIDKGKVSRHRI